MLESSARRNRELIEKRSRESGSFFFARRHLSDEANRPAVARAAYPVVGLYPVVKCKVVTLLVAGSS